MKTLLPPLCIAALLTSANPAQAGCLDLQGNVLLEPDPVCRLTTLGVLDRQFPDVTFLAEVGVPDTCFQGSVTGSMGSLQFTGNSLSAQTVNHYPPVAVDAQLFTAATALHLKTDGGYPLGTLYLRDTGVLNPNTFEVTEELVVVGGTRIFNGMKGSIAISGNEFAGAPFTGKLCY